MRRGMRLLVYSLDPALLVLMVALFGPLSLARLSDPRLLPVVIAAFEGYLADRTKEVGDAEALMIHNWREYSRYGEFLLWRPSDKKFFSRGMWANPNLWPLDHKRLHAAGRASGFGAY